MIILYNPRAAESKARIPMSIAALAAVLEPGALSTGGSEIPYVRPYEIVDGNLDRQAERRIEAIVEAGPGPHVLLVTVMPGPQLSRAVPQCKALKARYPDLTIVWGGYFPSMHPEVCLRSGYVDYVVAGQGELTMLELLDALERGGSLKSIDGLCYLENGSMRRNRSRALTDPNELPHFPYHRFAMERYLGRTFMGRRTVCHHTSVSWHRLPPYKRLVSLSL